MTVAQFRKLALSLAGVSEVPHGDRAAFRTKRRIFATLGTDGNVNLKIEPAEKREGLMDSFPDVFLSLGGWTRIGAVGVVLAKVDAPLFRELVVEAWQNSQAIVRKKR